MCVEDLMSYARKVMSSKKKWFVYLLRCADGSYYTGCTTDLPARVDKHNSGQGAKYTRSRLPVKLVYQEIQYGRSAAYKREAGIKKYSHDQKQTLSGDL